MRKVFLVLCVVLQHAISVRGLHHRPGFIPSPKSRCCSSAAPSLAALRAELSTADEVLPTPSEKQKLDRELLFIALPSLVALSCENLLSLVDTLFIGRLGAVQLGAAGIGISATCAAPIIPARSAQTNLPMLAT